MTFEIKETSFYLSSRKAFLNSGEIHYFRIRRSLWDRHLAAAREAGLTTVSTYVPWAWHEPEEGAFDFDGATCPERDLEGWLRQCQAAGLTCIVKPGPFILAKPAGPVCRTGFWIDTETKSKCATARVRSCPGTALACSTRRYSKQVTRWSTRSCPGISQRQISAGGPIILLQICNEIGVFSWLARQGDYGEGVRARFISYLSRKYKSVAEVNQPLGDWLPEFFSVKIPPDGRIPCELKGRSVPRS